MVLLNFSDWWQDLTYLNIIYWIISIPASIIFLIQLILSFKKPKNTAKESSRNDLDENVPKIDFQFFNFKNIIGFFTSFGWSGLACIDSDLSTISILYISFICGIILMLAMAIIFYFMKKLLKMVEEDM